MMLREMAAAILILTAAPVLADDLAPPSATNTTPAKDAKKKKSKKDAKAKADDAPIVVDPAPPMTTVRTAPAAAPAPALVEGRKGPTKDDPTGGLGLLGDSLEPPPGPPATDLELLTAPKVELSLDIGEQSFTPFDPKVLEHGTVCLFPFVREDSEANDKRRAQNTAALEDINTTFVDIAKRSKLHVQTMGNPQQLCGIDDYNCLASLGAANQCTAVLIGHSFHLDDGFVLRARFVDVASHTAISKLDKSITTNLASERQAWAQGQACNTLSVACSSNLRIDVDLPEMTVSVGGTPLGRNTAQVIEVFKLSPPGVYTLTASIGTSYSKDHVKIAARDGKTETVYVRERRDGSIVITTGATRPAASERPPSKVPFILGIVGIGLGVVAEGFAVQQYEHSQSLANGAADNYNANGYYKPADIADVSSARTAHTNSNIAAIVGGVLIVAGAVVALVTK